MTKSTKSAKSTSRAKKSNVMHLAAIKAWETRRANERAAKRAKATRRRK